ncbi:MAG: Mur ligase family protein [Pseudomonadota bacterium]|nr:Mur ligase family protein [Pseudomonadota bacterium]
MDKSRKILKRLELLHPKKIDLSLNRLKRLLKKLKNPQLKLPPTIHIAGTNGKGSVTSFLRSIFENAKLNVHTYTSPHLIRFNERIRINSKLISNYDLNQLLEECEYFNNGEKITFFEITTAAAFLGFSRITSDITLIETGLGGRYDATNVIKNKVCSVITPISMDHMNFLGTSIKKIAIEKLGILERSTSAIMSKQITSVRKLARSEAKKKNIQLYEEGRHWKVGKKNYKKKKFSLSFKESSYEFSFPSLNGEHQIDNASTAIATSLSLKNLNIGQKVINKGLLNVEWPARMQNLNNGKLCKIVGNRFEIWLDGGHNSHASNMINKVIQEWKNENIILILGMTIGKQPINFLKQIIKNISALVLLPINDHHYIQPYEIKNDVLLKLKTKISIFCKLDIEEALATVKKRFSSGKILISGSLYLAGDVLRRDGFKIK